MSEIARRLPSATETGSALAEAPLEGRDETERSRRFSAKYRWARAMLRATAPPLSSPPLSCEPRGLYRGKALGRLPSKAQLMNSRAVAANSTIRDWMVPPGAATPVSSAAKRPKPHGIEIIIRPIVWRA